MFLFECSKCRKRTYHPSKRLAQCCDGASFEQLVNICLLIPKQSEPTFRVVTKSPESSPLKIIPNQEWVTACNASELPKMRTASIEACTCYKCHSWINNRMKQFQAESEAKALQQMLETIEYVDEENPENSIPAKLEAITKEIDQATPETMDEILTRIESLHKSLKDRKILKY